MLEVARGCERWVENGVWYAQKQPLETVCKKKSSYKFYKIYRKTNVPASLFFVFSCEFCKISKNNFFTENLQATTTACKK